MCLGGGEGGGPGLEMDPIIYFCLYAGLIWCGRLFDLTRCRATLREVCPAGNKGPRAFSSLAHTQAHVKGRVGGWLARRTNKTKHPRRGFTRILPSKKKTEI